MVVNRQIQDVMLWASRVQAPKELRVARKEVSRRYLPNFMEMGQADSKNIYVLFEADRSTHTYVVGLSGCGKSCFLQDSIVQDIVCGRPVCLIDPTGSVFRPALDFTSYGLWFARHHLGWIGNEGEQKVSEQYLFIDFSDSNQPFRFDLLATRPEVGETVEAVVGDTMKGVERLLGSLDEQRRLQNILTTFLWLLAVARQVGVTHPTEGLFTIRHILELFMSEHFREEFRFELEQAVAQASLPRHEYDYSMKHLKFLEQFSRSALTEREESSVQVLQYFLRESIPRTFLDTAHGNLDFYDILNSGKSLFVHVPLGLSLKGGFFLGTLIATKLQRVAMRRAPEMRKHRHYLYIDEFHNFVDEEFARATAQLRQYGVSLVLAHQSLTQPPLNTDEGRGVLNTIKGNCRVKVTFQVAREDAEVLAPALIPIDGKKVRHVHFDSSVAVGASDAETEGKGRSHSDTKSQGQGTSHVHTDTQGSADGSSEQTSTTKTKGKSLQQSEGESDSEQEAYGGSSATTDTETESNDHGGSRATTTGHTSSSGKKTGANGPYNPDSSGLGIDGSWTDSTEHSDSDSESDTAGTNWRSGKSKGRTTQEGTNWQNSKSKTRSKNSAVTDATTEATQVARTVNRQTNRSSADATGYSTELSTAHSDSESESESRSKGRNAQVALTRKVEFWSVGDEREFQIEYLQALKQREFILVHEALQPVKLRTLDAPDGYAQSDKWMRKFMERQARRLTAVLSDVVMPNDCLETDFPLDDDPFALK